MNYSLCFLIIDIERGEVMCNSAQRINQVTLKCNEKKKFCSISSISFRRMDSNLRQRDTSKFNSKDLAPSENGDDSSRKSRSSSNSSNSSKKSRSSSSSSNRSTKMKPSMKKKAQKTPKAFKLLLFTIVLSKCLDFNIVDSLLVSLALIVAL